TVDRTAPTVSLTSVNGTARTFPFSTNQSVTSLGGACGTAAGDSATVNVAVTGAGTQNGTAACSAGGWTFTLASPLATTGTYTLTVTQPDAAGNTGTSSGQNITVDKTPPVVNITSVNGVAHTFPFSTNQNVTSVAGACGTATGDIATVSVSVGGAS